MYWHKCQNTTHDISHDILTTMSTSLTCRRSTVDNNSVTSHTLTSHDLTHGLTSTALNSYASFRANGTWACITHIMKSYLFKAIQRNLKILFTRRL